MLLIISFMPFLPLVVVVAAMFALTRMAIRRWIIHLATFVCLLAYPVYLITASAFEPTLNDASALFALGLLLPPYLFTAVLMLIGYCIFAWGKSRKAPAVSST